MELMQPKPGFIVLKTDAGTKRIVNINAIDCVQQFDERVVAVQMRSGVVLYFAGTVGSLVNHLSKLADVLEPL